MYFAKTTHFGKRREESSRLVVAASVDTLLVAQQFHDENWKLDNRTHLLSVLVSDYM